MDGPTRDQIVFTNKARCRDCYRCVRVCPVKAIRLSHGQASVQPERCIACGTCIRECPQRAKSYRDDTARVKALLAEGGPVAVSLAPSFAAAVTPWERMRLPSALRQLGFAHVSETAIGAYHVARETAQYVEAHPESPHMGTACPAAVAYVEQYRPEMTGVLTPVCSPMVAHARHLKATLAEGTKVVFIGPCVAKKAEAERPENAPHVDGVLTFEELFRWLEQDGIVLQGLEESGFDEEPEGRARLFPLEGGSLRTADLEADLLSGETLAASGFEEVRAALDELELAPRPVLVEPLMCPQGCVGGPAMPREGNVYDRRRQVLQYATDNPGRDAGVSWEQPALAADFGPRPLASPQTFTEEQVRKVLAQTGKVTVEDELNCGACGYPSCRDKAIAVLQGMAEPEMCIPYMRRLAEQRTDRIIETSPNGIVILDEHLEILGMNPAFRSMFMCTEAVLGKRISYLIDPDQFERLAAGQERIIEAVVRHERYHLACHQIAYRLEEDRQYVGIFVNITRSQSDRHKLDQLRQQTLAQARELLAHQIEMAQRMGQFLGESAAQGEKLVDNLMNLAAGEQDAGDKEGEDWLRDTYTSR